MAQDKEKQGAQTGGSLSILTPTITKTTFGNYNDIRLDLPSRVVTFTDAELCPKDISSRKLPDGDITCIKTKDHREYVFSNCTITLHRAFAQARAGDHVVVEIKHAGAAGAKSTTISKKIVEKTPAPLKK